MYNGIIIINIDKQIHSCIINVLINIKYKSNTHPTCQRGETSYSDMSLPAGNVLTMPPGSECDMARLSS